MKSNEVKWLRFIKEIFYPSVKCARIGHKVGFRKRTGTATTAYCRERDWVCWHSGFYLVRARIQYCKRCGTILDETLLSKEHIAHIVAGQGYFDKLSDIGVIWD